MSDRRVHARLSDDAIQHLQSTFARTRALYGGFRMMADDDGAGGDKGGDGDKGDQGSGDAGSDGKSGADGQSDKGFPADTPVADMTVEQQLAYYKHTSRKHETRATEYRSAAGGKTAAEVRADLEAAAELRRSQMSDADKALDTAREEARREVAAEFGNRLVAAEFKAALVNVDSERRDQIIEGLNLSAYLTDKGDVDTDKVQSFAAAIAPAGKEEGSQRRDYGAGRRGGQAKSGVTAGADLYTQRHKKTTSTT